MFTVCVRPPSGCTADSVTLDFYWATFVDDVTCLVTAYPTLTWTNPCADSYAVSYYYEVWYIESGVDTLKYTSGTLTGTVDPGVNYWATDTIGPLPDPLTGDQFAYMKVYVTWPDTIVREYTSFTDVIGGCR